MQRDKRKEANVKSFGLIGCGRIAQTHKEALMECPQSAIVAVADIENQKAGAMAEECKCNDYRDYKELVSIPELDCVVVAIPPNEHFNCVLFFIENGIHVICEKPITLGSEEARTLFAAAEEKGVVLMMASKFRYVRDIVKAKSIVKSGILGNIVHVENTFCSKVDMSTWWNSNPSISGGGVLMDNGCHSADIIRFLLGPIAKVFAVEGRQSQDLPVEDTVHLIFKTESGVTGTIDLSWSIHKELDHYLSIYGTSGMLLVGWQNSRYRQSEQLDWITFGTGYLKLTAFQDQIENFIDCIEKTDQPLINDTDAIESVKVIEAAYRSIETNQWAEV